MSNDKQQPKDQVQADQDAKRGAAVTEAQRRERARVEDEMKRAASPDAQTADEHQPGENLTEYHVRGYLANHLAQQLGYEPAQARDMARTKAAQMVNPEAEERHRQAHEREHNRPRRQAATA